MFRRAGRALDRWGWVIALVFLGIGFAVIHHQGNRLKEQGAEISKQQITLETQQSQLHTQVQNEAASRHAQTTSTVEARFANCESGNTLRKALKVNVEQGQRELPLLLELLPQLNQPRVLALNRQQVAYQLKAFALLHCKAYSEEILPGHSP